MKRCALVLLLATACVHAPVRATAPSEFSSSFGTSTLAEQGMSTQELIKLTTWIRDNPMPIYSILVSRHGRLVYELYTSSFGRDEAHYVMSITKSVTSALVGIAIDRHLLGDADSPIRDALPRKLFSDDDYRRFEGVTIKRVLGMAVFDASDPPRDRSVEAIARFGVFWRAPNRVAAALKQPLLQDQPFQYNGSTPILASGALRYASGKSVLAFAEETLFGPLGFRNYEWMHQDASGIDTGAVGLRLRPIDMQKLGVLYLSRGSWNGKQLISQSWIDRSFEPWNRSKPELERPDYGWFWWRYDYAPAWTAHVANGWKGQRILVIPEQGIVLTMTGCIEDGSETEFVTQLVTKILKPSVERGADADAKTAQAKLDALLAEVRSGPSRLGDFVEYRMVPSIAHKAARRALPDP